MPAYRIQSHTRHKSAQIVAGYIREADKWTKSGLYGVGFCIDSCDYARTTLLGGGH
jgi:hypothetical protein